MPNPASTKGPKAMLVDEAKLMGEWIRGLPLRGNNVCLNVGSSTRDFRERVQPHIHDEVIRPIELAGARVVHCDLKSADGVDEAGDLLDPAVQARLRTYDADLLICSNLLEHLTAPAEFAKACASLVRPGGYGLFSSRRVTVRSCSRIESPAARGPLGLQAVLSVVVAVGAFFLTDAMPPSIAEADEYISLWPMI